MSLANPWSYIWAAWETDLENFKQLDRIIESRELIMVMQNYRHAERIGDLNGCHLEALIWSVVAAIYEPKYSTNITGDYTHRAINIIQQNYSGDISVKSIANSLKHRPLLFLKCF